MTEAQDPLLAKEIELAIAALDKQFGSGSVVRLGNDNIQKVPVISTGAYSLDSVMGTGGFPKGRIIEIIGPESSGKSTLSLSVVAQAQALGLTCAFLDTEHALDPAYAKALGVNMDDLLFSQPDYGEMAISIAEALVKTGKVGVVVIDSVANLVPKAELEGDMEDMQMGLLARIMAKALRRLSIAASNTDTLIIFTNQLREKIGVMFGSPETTPGGRSLKFYASVRIDMRKKEELKDGQGNVIGIKSNIKVLKNKVGPSLRKTQFDVFYGKGIDTNGCIVDVALEKGVLVKAGAWIKRNGEVMAQGRDNAVSLLADDPQLAEDLKAEIENA